MKFLISIAFLAVLVMGIGLLANPTHAASLLKPGSANGDVWDLQYRLKALGLFSLQLTGKYDGATKSSVMRFQKAYGLHTDGITGSRTWSALKKYSLNKYEMDVMAKLIYSEARGEPYKGQVAVGAVIMNRIQSNQFPDNIRDVAFQPGAFTAIADGQYWLTPNKSAYLAALDAVRGWDPTYNSLYYFNPKTSTSKWIWSRKQNVTIGNHIFAS